ncbi:hypothetical protein [Bradyrhizobium sp. CCBAU 53421]|uniref:hypothetical protein n=1 Tax=Bradyrhizobium sp. CCBAU 53421 TaxID=1325120 RepID=UPI00188AF77B|nr:hypothetical protein [Bradyrhizobium sp. CCBAU 53421]QOZ36370.1 hypothetical protein XH92_35885 [Bradyrhizobium sp. CCBAU 53421]
MDHRHEGNVGPGSGDRLAQRNRPLRGQLGEQSLGAGSTCVVVVPVTGYLARGVNSSRRLVGLAHGAAFDRHAKVASVAVRLIQVGGS